MRKIIALVFLAIVSLTAFYACAQSAIKFEKATVDLGEFSQDTPVQNAEFVFTNTGTSPLAITSIRTSCGCTKAEYPKEPIAPGKKGKIKVVYDGSNKNPGYFNNAITVYNNTPDELYRIFIQGNMLPKEEKK